MNKIVNENGVFVELPRNHINFYGKTKEEKKANELIFDLSLENDYLNKEIDRLNSVINELEKWLKEYADKETLSSIIFAVVLNHLIVLKGENNEKD